MLLAWPLWGSVCTPPKIIVIVYHKDDPYLTLAITKRLEQTQSAASLAVTLAMESASKLKLCDKVC